MHKSSLKSPDNSLQIELLGKPAFPDSKGNIRIPQTVGQARLLQRLLINQCLDSKVKPERLAALAKAWCLVSEQLRVWTGRPSPGQLRPDLDPVQLVRAVKRARERNPIDIVDRSPDERHYLPRARGKVINATDVVERSGGQTDAGDAANAKESLSGETVGAGPGGGGPTREGGGE